jgi:4-oxalocrotonate tautomerase
VPEGDEFMTITEHDAANFRYGAALGMPRSDNPLFIQITVFNTRTVDEKKALRIAEYLGESPGLRPEDVFVNILEAAKENWSVGQGVAQLPGAFTRKRSYGDLGASSLGPEVREQDKTLTC